VLQARPGDRRAAVYEHLRRLAAEAGLELKQKSFVSNSRLALEAGEFARGVGPEAFDRFHRALLGAYFEDARDIGDLDVLLDVARGAGLDAESLRRALAEHRYAADVDDWTAWAQQNGIGGTPAFVFNNRFLMVGAQDYAVFADVARRLLASGEA
jgi:predicted DsbA family dithiol-disulfide isomerase